MRGRINNFMYLPSLKQLYFRLTTIIELVNRALIYDNYPHLTNNRVLLFLQNLKGDVWIDYKGKQRVPRGNKRGNTRRVLNTEGYVSKLRNFT